MQQSKGLVWECSKDLWKQLIFNPWVNRGQLKDGWMKVDVHHIQVNDYWMVRYKGSQMTSLWYLWLIFHQNLVDQSSSAIV